MKKKLLIASNLLLLLTGCAGPNSPKITVYTRDTSSGTRDGFFTGIDFKDAIKDNGPLVEGYVEVSSNGTMISAIKNDEYGLGYISLSSLEGSGVKGLAYEGVQPTTENVLNGTYSLTRNFNYCLRAEYANQANKQIVDAFVAYFGTVEGKATIQEHGGILLTSPTDPSWKTLKNEFTIDDQDNSGVTLHVGGSTSVKSIVSNLLSEFSAKCGNFAYDYAPTGSGDAYKRTNGAEKDGVYACDLAFASREFNESEAMADELKGKMCIDAIVPAVNQNNAVSNITAKQLKDIYSGVIKTWNELGE